MSITREDSEILFGTSLFAPEEILSAFGAARVPVGETSGHDRLVRVYSALGWLSSLPEAYRDVATKAVEEAARHVSRERGRNRECSLEHIARFISDWIAVN